MALKLVDGVMLYRPMQYLGAKLRSLEVVGQAIDGLKHRPHSALDMFSGSSVVSQYMKSRGMRVTANDAMAFCSIVAEATIGNTDTNNTFDQLLKLIGKDIQDASAWGLYKDYAILEQKAISSGQSEALIDMYHNLPQAWRGSSLLNLKENEGKSSFQRGDVISSLYAGTYFGVNQAVSIDYIRNRIEVLANSQKITLYEKALTLTALISAMSKSVFSAGKHFAQPHLIRDGKDQSFAERRILADRSISIFDEFEAALREIIELRRGSLSNNSVALKGPFEHLLHGQDQTTYDLIYVDPPYTAQQYSRFYHIPEVLANYEFPELQVVKGSVTRGLYPVERFKSRFCSKREAGNAFEDVFSFADKNNSSVILSYSLSKNGKTGNDRMISFDDLMSICRNYSGRNVSVIEFDHVYRQFNKQSFINNVKEDKEIQIVCERS